MLEHNSAQVQGVLKDGLWMLVQGREYFLPFAQYPWLRTASVSTLQRVELLHSHHLYWPDLDVDVAVESLEHPERYPLMFRA